MKPRALIDQVFVSLTDQFELTEATSAQQRDERSTSQKLTFLRNLWAYKNRGQSPAAGARPTSYSLNSDAISSKGGVADQALQNGALLTAKATNENSATFRSHIPAAIPTNADAVDPLLQERALLTAEGLDAISANNAVSPFLSLPQEVKDRIYELACGGNLIHIDYSTDEELSHHICQAVVTGNDNHNIFDTTKSPSFLSDATKRHAHCYNCRYADLGLFQHILPAKYRYNLDLRFLRTCKQIHWEAKSIPFTSNTFFFEQPYTLFAILARNPNGACVPNVTSIRTVHFEMTICDAGDHESYFGALTLMTSQLKSLQKLYVVLKFRPYDIYSPLHGYDCDPLKKQFMEDLVSLRLRQLQTVTFILSEYVGGTNRLILDQTKQEWGEYINGVRRPMSREGDNLIKYLAI